MQQTTHAVYSIYYKQGNKLELEFMFMKHYAPNKCDQALNFGGGGGGGGGRGRGIRADVNGEVKFL